jgi:hypothetical protein
MSVDVREPARTPAVALHVRHTRTQPDPIDTGRIVAPRLLTDARIRHENLEGGHHE